MKIFLDSADLKQIEKYASTGLINGVTTNPSLIAKNGSNIFDTIKKICAIIYGPVSAEVTATDCNSMIREAEKLSKIAKNVTIKLPLTFEGLNACKILTDKGMETNVTLCFTPAQAILAAKAGATFISPFVGRLDDIGLDGMDLIKNIKKICENYNFKTQILVASIRTVSHVVEAAKIGADVITIPPKIFEAMYNHPLTVSGLDMFLKDWENSKQKIL